MGLLIHVPLGVLHIIGVVRGLGIGRFPQGIGIRNMSDEGFVVCGNILVDGLEDGIIRQDVMFLRILDFHADVLPDFYGNGPLIKIVVDLANDGLSETGLSEFERIKSGA